jgi:hypothetical protein
MAGSSTKDLIIKFLADTRALEDGVKKADGAMGKLTTAAKVVGGAFVATKVVSFLGDATKAAEEDAASQRVLALEIKNTTDATDDQIAGVETFIDHLARASGVADDSLRPAYAALVRSTGDIGTAQEQLGAAMDIAAGRGVDLESVTKALEKANNGNVTALGKLGVATKDAAGNTLSLEQIMANAATTYAGAAEAAVTPSQRWKVATDELKESIGARLLPVMGKIAEVGSSILAWFSNLSPNMQLAIEIAGALVVGLVALTAVAGVLAPAIGLVVAAVGLLISPVGLVIIGIAALAAGLIYAYTHFETFRNIVDGVIDTVSAIITGFIDGSKKAWHDWGDTIMKVFESVASVVKIQIGIVRGIIQPIIDLLHGDWGKAWDDFKAAIALVWEGITGLIRTQVGIIKDLAGGVIDVVKAAYNAFRDVWNSIDIEIPKFHVIGTNIDLGGGSFGLPDLPRLDRGGIVEKTGLAVVHEGETYSGVGSARTPTGGAASIIITGPVYLQTDLSEDDVVRKFNAWARRNNGVRTPGGVTAVS